MESSLPLIPALGAALIGIVIIYKLLKGVLRTIGLAVIAVLIAGFLYMNGAFG